MKPSTEHIPNYESTFKFATNQIKIHKFRDYQVVELLNQSFKVDKEVSISEIVYHPLQELQEAQV